MAWTSRTGASTIHRQVPRLAMLANVADALDELHKVNLVHADIKPSNIRIEERYNRSVLVDYGMVRVATSATNHQHSVVGTPGYWAPEVTSHAQYSSSSDLYAFATTVVFAATSLQPPEGTTPDAIVEWAGRQLADAGWQPDSIATIKQALSPRQQDRDPNMTASLMLSRVRRTRTTTLPTEHRTTPATSTQPTPAQSPETPGGPPLAGGPRRRSDRGRLDRRSATRRRRASVIGRLQ